jgi:hypothetical protein
MLHRKWAMKMEDVMQEEPYAGKLLVKFYKKERGGNEAIYPGIIKIEARQLHLNKAPKKIHSFFTNFHDMKIISFSITLQSLFFRQTF